MLAKMAGSGVSFETQAEIAKHFGNEFQSKIKSVIARALNESDMELLGIDSRLDEFSAVLFPFMKGIVEPYGLSCVSFTIVALDIEDSELRAKYDEIGMEVISKLRTAQADKAVIQTLGNDWAHLQTVNILTNLSKNAGAVSFSGDLAMGIANGKSIEQMTNQLFDMKSATNISPAENATDVNSNDQDNSIEPVCENRENR